MGKNKRKLQEGAEQARQDAPKEERDAKHEMDMKKKHREGVGEGQQTEGKKKKKDSEIDDIFGSGPAKKGAAHGTSNSGTHKEEDTSKTGGEKGKEASKKPKIEGSKDDLFGEDAKQARKRTEEGYAIYTEEELGLLRKGGDTPDCPFDCACCF
mmetsp:Transcript_2461/g.6338  ORF Transcript_2461/g.6338 Transcript_2461/m.6338 type:complete len:154 (+) Transcript_2461:42-503(+)|eukprot:CAMPEP_0202357318 /NCGR_PEP_ID=MMETSP1126-20121109/11389_1 /ASSEMBLY_ACC=CAM_ASM_000457 /TAXON_ID=3047 /ORGANISM="Dunaliella tertiolecta, Strain CCMP1320" /LENGTH=153 /DNA_ID=CAMNT_0048950167 /DNA_START=136 /DNA_END=597 /DNA_ORIENTATION=-